MDRNQYVINEIPNLTYEVLCQTNRTNRQLFQTADSFFQAIAYSELALISLIFPINKHILHRIQIAETILHFR